MTELERACLALNSLDSHCSREEWIRIGISAKAAGLSFDDFYRWSKPAGNYKSEKDCRSVWESFKAEGGISGATLFHIAREKGWQDNAKNHTSAINTNRNKKRKKTHHNKNGNTYVLEIWNKCQPAISSHWYILRKQGMPDGLRVYPATAPTLIINGQNVAGYLVVPCVSDSHIQTLQFIPPNEGKKLNLNGTTFNDGYFVVGDIDKTKSTIYLTESIGNAWAIHRATEAPVVVFFGSSRMPKIARVLRDKYSNVILTLVPDRGCEGQAAKIAFEVNCQWVELPKDKHSNYDVNDYAKEYGHNELSNLLKAVKVPEMRYKLLSGADLVNAPPMSWIVQGVLPAEGLAALYGASGCGKSFLILNMGCAVAAGDNYWFGRRVIQAPVTYACLEGEAGMGKRLKAWSLYFKRPLPDALCFITQPFDLRSHDVVELARSVIAAGSAGGLLIVDTLNRAAPGADENSSVDMGNMIAAAKQLQNLIGGLVLLVHHTGKDATKGLRGHSSLYASLDAAIEVLKTETRREWSVAKSKDDVTGDSHPFKLEVVQIGYDTEGEAITSCVAEFDDSKSVLQKKKIALGSNQTIALKLLGEQLHTSSHTNKEGVPEGKSCVIYDEAVSLVADQMPTDSKHRKSSAKTAIAGLVGKGMLGMKGDWLWSI